MKTLLTNPFDTHLALLEIFARLATATFLASLLGVEREMHRKPAGLRTYMMVGLGSAGFTVVTLELVHFTIHTYSGLTADPIRIISGVVGGIGFLGAGSILHSRGSVEGITTAAGIWVVGAIGIACGAGFVVIALMVVALAFLVFAGVGLFERIVFHKGQGPSAQDKE